MTKKSCCLSEKANERLTSNVSSEAGKVKGLKTKQKILFDHGTLKLRVFHKKVGMLTVKHKNG